ncbi:MAG: hypothetical protein HPY45_13100 [Anaerolineae bacterium]|nr:hypothetical protein [Anaerolineae bacterium]
MAHADKRSEAQEVNERRLIAAVIVRAFEDARHGDLSAVLWLLDDGLLWLDAVGLDVTAEQMVSAIKSYRARGRKNQKFF